MWSKEEDKSTSLSWQIRNEKGGGILDTLLVCILVSILIGAVIPHYQQLMQEAKEATLQSSLVNIRKSIELHRVLQGEYPHNLQSLVHKQYVIPVREDTFFSGEYLRSQVVDAEGNLLDPFGNRYRYDRGNGRVHSGTQGYEHW